MLVLATLLFFPQVADRPFPDQSDWIDVPAFVVDEVAVEEESWKAENGFKCSGESLRVVGRLTTSDCLEVLVTNFTGLYGVDLVLRLSTSKEGRVSVKVSSNWHTDVGDLTFGPNSDLHGDVLIQERQSGEKQPLKMSFRLHGIMVGFNSTASPMLTEGEISLPLDALDWSPTIQAPGPGRRTGTVAKEQFREVSSNWPEGKPRSHGWVDPRGRRQGLWSTWYSDGKKQSESMFVHGEREGPWSGFWSDGRPFEAGPFRNGVREGEWTAKWAYEDQVTTRRGSYIAGLKEGEWIDRWQNGSMRSRGAFKGGRRTGPWTTWWPNGNKLCEGVEELGYPVGKWSYWNKDGSLREVVTKKLPPWARK